MCIEGRGSGSGGGMGRERKFHRGIGEGRVLAWEAHREWVEGGTKCTEGVASGKESVEGMRE